MPFRAELKKIHFVRVLYGCFNTRSAEATQNYMGKIANPCNFLRSGL